MISSSSFWTRKRDSCPWCSFCTWCSRKWLRLNKTSHTFQQIKKLSVKNRKIEYKYNWNLACFRNILLKKDSDLIGIFNIYFMTTFLYLVIFFSFFFFLQKYSKIFFNHSQLKHLIFCTQLVVSNHKNTSYVWKCLFISVLFVSDLIYSFTFFVVVVAFTVSIKQ